MPIYQYKCETCDLEFEEVRAIKDPPLEKCQRPECKGKPKRLISRTSFVLNGGGWAKDGY